MPSVPAASSTPDLLRMEGVEKNFGPTRALAGVSLTARAGEVLALVGENGAGKSTLMKVLSGVHTPDAGTLTLDGKPFHPRTPLDSREAGIAMIYQELALAPHLSVAENIVLGIEPGRGGFMNWRETRTLARKALTTVGLDHISTETTVSELPPAERQLIEIGRAVVVGARILVLDEPTSSLTQKDIERLFALIRQLKAQGLAIIYISHFLEEVRAVCDRITVLRDGRSVGEARVSEITDNEIVAMMVGRDVHELYPRTLRTTGDVIISLENIAGSSKPSSASLELRAGEVLGIAGLIGAGRTELLRLVFGLDKVRSGEIRVGTYIGRATPDERWKQSIGLVSEDRKLEGLALDLSIADNMTLTRLNTFVNPARLAEDARRWIEKLGIKCQSPNQPAGALSGGNQQKIAIGRLLHHDVDVLLLDEPTRGIDIGAKATIYRQIDELACAGKAVLVVSSYLPELLGICDRIAVMCRGVLGEARPVAQTDAHQIMLEATGRS
ncbi:sugar ABC transporter [Nibricoccus aquaticus]|uniref:Sugar ABC transporter n=1 Tax=Nibricoccus aquaticus TaxID=2576891 RepID=A0A290Q6X2_9BACT|nr:sugar ABC transporter ATP-binding protein [Nibricoccus aquaticus]ATC64425.1 sugar ABC transporter [Nibricoccus aquaticus]